MNLPIKKATKSESKLRMSLIGASGSGKTFTALSIAENLGSRILFVDTEHGSASKYADLFDFDVIELSDFAPEKFIEIIEFVRKQPDAERYDVIVLDSLSHAWMGKGGILEQHGNAEARTKNSFTAWKDVTPKHNALIEAIVQSPSHLIATMRAKTEYAMKKDDKTNRTSVQTVGLAPIQRDGMEYEFDVVAHLDEDNNFIVKKTRCPQLSEKVFNKAGLQVAEILKVWLAGVPVTTVKMPNLEIVKPTAAATETPKSDYSQEWSEKLANPVPKVVEAAPVSAATKGRLLFENGNVSRTAKGYAVSENYEGQKVISEVTKQNGAVVCDCVRYADGISDTADFSCEHIEAVRFFAAAQSHAQASRAA